MAKVERLKYTLPSRVKVSELDLTFLAPPERFKADWTLVEKVPEWLQNFRVNYETIGFDKSVAELPPIKGSALVVEKSMASRTFYENVEKLKGYKGVIIATDRAYPYLCRKQIVPTYVCQIDSSYLCQYFFDVPEAKKFMDKVKGGVFAVTTHPLTIRLWHGNRYFFTPYIGSWNLTLSLSKLSNMPIMVTGGEVSTLCWVLACALGANPIAMFGVMNCYEDMSETEYPGTPHKKVKSKYGVFYQDKVYESYAKVHHALIKCAKQKLGVETINTTQSGIMYSKWITDMPLKEFVEKYA
jgi:hypothetical protein